MENISCLTTEKLNRQLICLLFSLIISLSAFSQNVGINSTGMAPNPSAGLDVDFPNKGLLIPRVALTGTTNFAPLLAHVAGMIVYNTATVSDVIPGFYYNNGTKWVAGFPAGNAIGNMLYWNGTDWVLLPAGSPGQYLQVSGTNLPFWGALITPVPTITTAAANAIDSISAKSGANITGDGGSPILTRGVCWNTISGPTIANNKTTDGSGIGIYISSLTGLLPVTTYYVRAYAINATTVNYGNEVSFTTNAELPTLTATTAATAITATSATTGGWVTKTGGVPITERGVCYATTANPTIANTKVIDPSPGVGSFTSNLTGLTGFTTYYVRAYATNSVGTAYGTQISFRTLSLPPTLVTVPATSITGTSAVSGASMSWNGGGYSNYQNYGVAYATTPGALTPTYVATNTTNGSVNPAVPIAPWVTTLTGLTANTTYYIRSYLNLYVSGTGPWVTIFGNELSFTTTAPTAPVVASTTAITAIATTTASGGGNVTSDGGAPITAKGICWNTAPSPTTANSFTTNGTTTGTFVSSLTGLSPSTLYYVRAYATNSVGTTYGPEITFTTCGTPFYTKGQSVAGGIVYYVDCSGQQGLIVSTVDLATNVAWGCSGTLLGASGTAIYTGLANTNAIIAACATPGIPARLCADYTAGGINIPNFTNWYLPSRDELQLLSSSGLVSPPSNLYTHWSSTEGSATLATGWFFNGNYQVSVVKTSATQNVVRAVRKWTAPVVVLPTITTDPITAIASTTATGGGNITADGGAPCSASGVCWNTTTGPTTANFKTTDNVPSGTFTSSLTGLAPSTTYYVRAYATNTAGTAYGNEVSFTTAGPSIATLTTDLISNLTQTTATSGGNITTDGGAAVTARGVCWGTAAAPTIADTKTTDGTGSGTFVSSITGLVSGTVYYLRAYATNSVGTAYGNEVSFTTPALATLTTAAITNIGGTSATSGGNITNAGGSLIIARGVCWSLTPSPTVGVGNFTSDGIGTGVFASNITGLTSGLLYYVRAYAQNSIGIAYGNELSFTPAGPALATLTTTPITNPTSTGGTSGGNITSDGGAAITARGVCWGINPSPVPGIGNFTSDGTGSGVFISTITGLTAGNSYFIRAYATNSVGTAYGNEEIYMPAGPPTVATLPITYVAPATTGTSGVNVITDGGSPLTALGIVWSTTPGPTILTHLGITSENLLLGWNQNSTITGLVQSTTYYVRAYATNAVGTSYGAEVSFTPGVLGLPVVTTSQIYNKIGAIAEGGGDVLSDGGDPGGILAFGLCWNTTGAPTITDPNTNVGAWTGQFFSPITGLSIGTTYHLRAYATNSFGTAYGNEVVFTETAATPGQFISGGNIWGFVFSVDGTGLHGLIADPWGFGTYDWGCTGTNAGASGIAIGTGFSNTTSILNDIALNLCTSPVFSYAAQVTQSLGPDWYLPSKDEFNLLWTNRAINIDLDLNLTTAAATAPFWSSSEVNLTPATLVWVFDGTIGTWFNNGVKSALYNVWPIRSF